MKLQPGVVMPGGAVPFGGSLPDFFVGADLVLDFARGDYRRGATRGSTLASISATLNGTATIDGSGLLCDAVGESVSTTYSVAVPFIMVVDYASQPSATLAGLAELGTGTPALLTVYKNSTSTVSQSQVQISGTYSGGGKVATGFNATQHVVSFGGAAVQANAQATPTFSGSPLTIGNFGGGNNPAGIYIRSVAIYLGTFSNAQIQALAT